MSPSPPSDSETTARLDAIAKERDALRQEVTGLRKSLESIQSKHEGQPTEGAQSKHEEEVHALREELEEATEGKEHFETQYNNLLGRVNTIKTSLGNRMKADAVGVAFCTYGATSRLTACRPKSKSTRLRSQICKTSTQSCRRRTAASATNSRNCGRRTRHKRPRSAACGADRLCLNRTGQRSATSSYPAKHTREKSLRMQNKPCRTGRSWP